MENFLARCRHNHERANPPLGGDAKSAGLYQAEAAELPRGAVYRARLISPPEQGKR